MHFDTFSKIKQIHPLFKSITQPFDKLLNTSFGYMRVFKNADYYTIIEDLECLIKFVTHVKTSKIFCDRNVTNYFDDNYIFTLWPNEPSCIAMDVYHQYGNWNGITVSKVEKNYTELYWFTQKEATINWHKFFIRNKKLLLEFIKYFNSYKAFLNIPEDSIGQNLFKFPGGFDINLQESEYIEKDSHIINQIFESFDLNSASITPLQINDKILSIRESEVFSIIGQGYTTKVAAQKLCLSPRTIRHHIENIKEKLGLHFKTDLIKSYQEKHLVNYNFNRFRDKK